MPGISIFIHRAESFSGRYCCWALSLLSPLYRGRPVPGAAPRPGSGSSPPARLPHQIRALTSLHHRAKFAWETSPTQIVGSLPCSTYQVPSLFQFAGSSPCFAVGSLPCPGCWGPFPGIGGLSLLQLSRSIPCPKWGSWPAPNTEVPSLPSLSVSLLCPGY